MHPSQNSHLTPTNTVPFFTWNHFWKPSSTFQPSPTTHSTSSAMARPSESSPLLPSEPAVERYSPIYEDVKTAPQEAKSSVDTTDILRDVIIGFSDGVTVPFALTAGLSSLGNSKIVIMGGLAELFSGMISMGLGAYLAAITERDHYTSQEERERMQVECMPEAQRSEVFGILEKYQVSRAAAAPLVEELCKNREQWARFMVDFSLRLERPNIHRAWVSGVTMGLSYFVGGLIPMIPYFVMPHVGDAFLVSIAVTAVILIAFGYVKNYVAIRNHRAGAWGAVQTLIIGFLAAGTSYAIVKLLD